MGSQKQLRFTVKVQLQLSLLQLRSKIQYSSGELKGIKITGITNKSVPAHIFQVIKMSEKLD